MAEVRVTLRYSDSGTQSMLLFFTRAIDAAYVGLVPYVLGLAYGLPLQLVGVASSGSPSHGVVTRGELPPATEPIRIATVLGSSGHFVGWSWINKASLRGLFIDLPPQEQVHALREGYVHAAATWEPYVSACVADGGRLAFKATDLPFPLLDVIVATEDGPGAEGIDSLVRLHATLSKRLVEGASLEDLNYIRRLFRVNWSDERIQELIGSSFVMAASQDFDQTQLAMATQLVSEFVTSAGLGVAGSEQENLAGRMSVRQYVPEREPSQNVELRIGYSEDLMCVPILLAWSLKDIAQVPVIFETTVQREEERIASLPDSLRESVEQARELITVDAALATMKMARLVELSLRSISDQALGKQSPKQISRGDFRVGGGGHSSTHRCDLGPLDPKRSQRCCSSGRFGASHCIGGTDTLAGHHGVDPGERRCARTAMPPLLTARTTRVGCMSHMYVAVRANMRALRTGT